MTINKINMSNKKEKQEKFVFMPGHPQANRNGFVEISNTKLIKDVTHSSVDNNGFAKKEN